MIILHVFSISQREPWMHEEPQAHSLGFHPQ